MAEQQLRSRGLGGVEVRSRAGGGTLGGGGGFRFGACGEGGVGFGGSGNPVFRCRKLK